MTDNPDEQASPNPLLELETYLEAHPDTRYMDVFAPDLNGCLRGKRISRDEFAKAFKNRVNYPKATPLMSVRGENSEKTLYGAGDGDPDIYAGAVPGTLAPVPWAIQPTAQCMLRLFESDGAPLNLDPRTVLGHAVQPLLDLGLRPVLATELEFFLINYDGRTWRPRGPRIPGSDRLQTGKQYGSFDDIEEVEGFLSQLDAYAEAQNLPVGATLSEYATAQFEVNLHHVDDPALACDHAVLLKRAVKEAARQQGMTATFMAKPFSYEAGSGMHVHVSLLDEDGNNVFAGQCEDGDFSDTLRHAIGGLGAMAPECMAMFAPTANAYRRFAPGYFAPASTRWGVNHRDLALRIPLSNAANRRVEHRIASADANPYLVVACILAGMHHGIVNRIDPGEMVPENAELDYEQTLPIRWSHALDAYEAGKLLPGYLGAEYHDIYGRVQRDQWEQFHALVTDRDYEWYLRAV